MKALLRISLLLALAAGAVHAQPSKADMLAITMPAPFYNKTDDIAYPGDWGYWTVGTTRGLDNADLGNPSNWNWVRYTNSGKAKEVWAMVGMGGSACNHAHLSYGLWGRYSVNIGFATIKGWTRIGMGTQSGEKVGTQCKWDVDNSWVDFAGEDFGWGTNYATGNYRNSIFKYSEFVLGGIAMAHGGGCGGNFQCGFPLNAYLWTVP